MALSLAVISTLLLPVTIAPLKTWASIVSVILFSEIAPVRDRVPEPDTPADNVLIVPVEEAEREGRAALHLEREQENRLWALYTIAGLAQLALSRGDLEHAGVLWGACEAARAGLRR